MNLKDICHACKNTYRWHGHCMLSRQTRLPNSQGEIKQLLNEEFEASDWTVVVCDHLKLRQANTLIPTEETFCQDVGTRLVFTFGHHCFPGKDSNLSKTLLFYTLIVDT